MLITREKIIICFLKGKYCQRRHRKTPNISPSIKQSHKHFWWAYTRVGLYPVRGGGLIHGTTFVSGIFQTCYLYLKKEE